VATTTGRGMGVIYQLYLFSRGNARIKLYRKELSIDLQTIGKLIRLSMGGIGQNIIATSSWIGMMRIVSIFGSNVLAGYTIAIRIVVFALLPSWGLSNAASTLVGQNLGAKQPERAERTVWITAYANMILLGLVGIVLIIFPEAFVRLFISDQNVISNGAVSLRIISLGFVSYAMGMVMTQAFNGSGDTVTPTRINFFCFWLLEIPLAYFLAIVLDLKIYGISIAIVAAETALTLTALYFFRKGKWKTVKV